MGDTDSDVGELSAVLDDLNLHDKSHSSDVQQPRKQPGKPLKRPAPKPAPAADARPPSLDPAAHIERLPDESPAYIERLPDESRQRLPDESNLYHFSSATESGYTNKWDVAAQKTQGVAGGSPLRLSPKKKSRGPSGGVAVFVGTKPGAYPSWEEAEQYVKGVRGSIYQGYQSVEKADAAFQYAQERSWTRLSTPRNSSRSAPPPTPIPRLPTPIFDLSAVTDAPNPLHTADTVRQGLWYNVYSGISPGIYQSSLEMSLNTVGVPGAVYNSCDSQELAVQRFKDALAEGRIEVITPLYYP
ncbi:hypothetical protein DFH06DRAFT_1146230 [Mycena polygramma]|nr:hypothetical protein DFH06DRAFT_1146230 [Mycena polygramma]